MQRSSSSRIFNPPLAGASPATDANFVRVAQLDQSATVRRWRPQVRFLPWAPFKAPVPQQQQGEFRKLVFVGASPTRGPINGDHDVTAASRPVKAFVPVRIRLVTPNLDRLRVSGALAAIQPEPRKDRKRFRPLLTYKTRKLRR